ncbi:MAG: ubiquitin-conjugating enzyme E2, partial [Desulfobulbaceae bacterium]
MSSGEQQLQADFALVKKLLNDYPCIKLLATKGEPPEQYDIEYRIKGYKAHTDGTILPANKHQVRISLPFGYPHFPPTAKPLTSIFHPDIDPDAIRIADFWKESKSLPELIIHIGKMICGTFYSGDPFNQQAFDWYEERKSWMPFDILEAHEGDDEEEYSISRAPAAPPAASEERPGLVAEETAAVSQEEEISLDFAGENEPAEAKAANGELGDMLEGEFSFAFDLEEHAGETADVSGIMEDLTTVDADMEFELEPSAVSEDLTTLQEEPLSLDFGLQLEPEDSAAEMKFTDQPEGPQDDFAAGFNLEEEPAPFRPETIDLGDLAGLGEEVPVESLTPATGSEELSGPGGPAVTEPAPPAEDFSIDFGIAGAEQIPAEDRAAPESTTIEEMLGGISLQLDEEHGNKYGGQARSIRPLIDQKQIFTAKKVLADIADPGSVPDYEELELTIADAIDETEDLFKKADTLEQKGELEKAGLILDLVANIATDYPGLEFARNRIRESLMAGGQKKAASGEGKEAAAAEARETGAEQPVLKTKGIPTLGVKVPYKLLGALLVLAGIVGGGTALYLKDNSSLDKARAELNRGRQLVENKDFKEAEKAFTTARKELGGILLQRGGKQEVGRAIDTIVNAQPFKEGLQGRVLYNGEYVTVAAAKAIDSFSQHFAAAEKANQAGNIDQAIAAYEKGLEYADQAGFQDNTGYIRHTVSTLRLQQAMAQAQKAEEGKEWKKAADTYQKALELSSTLAKPEEQGDIAKRLAAAALHLELDKSKRAFTASEWLKSVEMLQGAQKIIVENPTLVSDTEKLEIEKLLINAKVFQILAVAKKAFTQQDLDGAVKEYNRATQLLRDSEAVLGKEEVADSTGKIEKTILMTRITREQNQIERGVTESGKLSTNLKHYRTIAALIEKSPLQEDTILRKILEDSRTQIANLEKDILISSKVEYLKANYEDIFRKSYPSAKSSELLAPQAAFVKQE